MVHTEPQSTRRNEKRPREKNERPYVIQGNDGNHNDNTREAPEKVKKIQIGPKEKEVLTAPWMDRKGRSMIRLRRIKNRAWRRARKKNAPQRVQQLLKRKYENQKRVTSIYLGNKKGNWEKEMIEKAKENNKVLWNFAKDIQGKTRKRDEKTLIGVIKEDLIFSLK